MEFAIKNQEFLELPFWTISRKINQMTKLSKDCKIPYFRAFIDQIRAKTKFQFSNFIQKSERA